MAKKTNPESSLVGRWRITLMEQWDQKVMDAEVKGFFEFRPDGQGDFQFGYVSGEIGYRPTIRDGKARPTELSSTPGSQRILVTFERDNIK